jgi:hypothetical protein
MKMAIGMALAIFTADMENNTIRVIILKILFI